MTEKPIFDGVQYKCSVNLIMANGQKFLGTTEFHDELLNALQKHFNMPTTPFYVSEVSVYGMTILESE